LQNILEEEAKLFSQLKNKNQHSQAFFSTQRGKPVLSIVAAREQTQSSERVTPTRTRTSHAPSHPYTQTLATMSQMAGGVTRVKQS
jgi:hypothetical protein